MRELDKITSVFTGEDGGICFLKLKIFLEEIGKKEEQGDKDAEKILLIVKHFVNLLDYVENNTGI